jgi:hypothetical protein
MKNLNLNEAQFALVIQALGIAERQFQKLHTQMVQSMEIVRNHAPKDGSPEWDAVTQFHKSACALADLNEDLKAGKFDAK